MCMCIYILFCFIFIRPFFPNNSHCLRFAFRTLGECQQILTNYPWLLFAFRTLGECEQTLTNYPWLRFAFRTLGECQQTLKCHSSLSNSLSRNQHQPDTEFMRPWDYKGAFPALAPTNLSGFHSPPAVGSLSPLPPSGGSLPNLLPTLCAYLHQRDLVRVVMIVDLCCSCFRISYQCNGRTTSDKHRFYLGLLPQLLIYSFD